MLELPECEENGFDGLHCPRYYGGGSCSYCGTPQPKAEPHPCRWFNGRCIDCGRAYGQPRAVSGVLAVDLPEPVATISADLYGGASVHWIRKPNELPAGSKLYDEAALDYAYAQGRADQAADGVPGTFNDQGENHG